MPRNPGMGESGLPAEPDRGGSLSPAVAVGPAFLAEAGLSTGPLERPDRLIDQSLAL